MTPFDAVALAPPLFQNHTWDALADAMGQPR
jgi:hypothetical protein